jgi:hypothetical protein
LAAVPQHVGRKAVVVSGANTGLGLATASGLAALGARAILPAETWTGRLQGATSFTRPGSTPRSLVNQAFSVNFQKFPSFGGSNWQNPLSFDSGLIDADDYPTPSSIWSPTAADTSPAPQCAVGAGICSKP